jgi:hypothetical protein
MCGKMRDEIYARHGKVSKNEWTQKYFASFDWYKPIRKFTDASLTSWRKQTLTTIALTKKRA